MTIHLVCLLGDNPEVVFETIKMEMEENNGNSYLLYIIGSDAINHNRQREITNTLNIINDMDNVKYHYFIIKNTGDVNTRCQSTTMGEGILRVLLLAQEKAQEKDEIWLSIAGGRKTMSASANFGQVLVNIRKILHIVASQDVMQQRYPTVEKVRNGWDEIKQDNLLHPIELPALESWNLVFGEFLLGLGRKISLKYYDLKEEERRKLVSDITIDFKNHTKTYIVQENSILEDITSAGKYVGNIISIAESIGFNTFQHDIKDMYDYIADEECKKKRDDLTELVIKYCNNVARIVKIIKQQKKCSPFHKRKARHVWQTIEDIIKILSHGKLEKCDEKCDENTRIYLLKGKKEKYEIQFSVDFPDSGKLIPEEYLYTIYRNLIKNMIKHGKTPFVINIKADDKYMMIQSQNKIIEPEKIPSLEEKINNGSFGLPYDSNRSDEKGMGLYLIRTIYFLINGQLEQSDIQKMFVVNQQEETFTVNISLTF